MLVIFARTFVFVGRNRRESVYYVVTDPKLGLINRFGFESFKGLDNDYMYTRYTQQETSVVPIFLVTSPECILWKPWKPWKPTRTSRIRANLRSRKPGKH